ncbi:NAD(P)H-dependent flavin oxidoreductase [Candidatus Pantoea multigeneris]|uniref:Nitronate monooxygenase n=1 Tax=Candidatus Pantoea multigeneris TaxID=2608357 RepID=A0ABX0R8F6_9GAMM|nr:nitronate monooxygenase [Pantoea multigeneris]NIF20418.1 nitronate monooxygenase [Pantoea multigeneris]
MSTLSTALTRLLNIQHPLVLAPMGGVSGAELTRAVSQAGGLGLLGASYGDADWMRPQLSALRDLEQPWGVGLVMFTVARRMELLHLALDYGPDVVALSFGEVKPFIQPIHSNGAKVIVQVHDVDQAIVAHEAGADALIVQGAEAGGHSLKRASLPLFPAVRDALGETVILIGAGGIADGRGVAAAFDLGMDGAMLGTRFLASDEAIPSLKVKQRLVDAVASDTVRTRIFDDVRGISWPAPYSGRAIANAFSTEWIGKEAALAADVEALGQAYSQALAEDNVDIRAIWAGEVSDLITNVQSAETIVHTTIRETVAQLQRQQRYLIN